MFSMLPSTAVTRRRNNLSEALHTLRASSESDFGTSADAVTLPRSFATRLLQMPFLALAGP